MMRYDREQDTLILNLTPRSDKATEFEGQGVVAVVNPSGRLAEVRIPNATRWLAQAQEAGVPPMVEEGAEPRAERMVWVQADSTMIDVFGYDAEARALEVVFRRGGTYRYYDVPPDVFAGLRVAPSKGRYMHEHIIGVYRWVRLTRSRAPLA